MVSKLNEKALLGVEEAAFRSAVIRKVNRLIDAVNTGVVWDNRVATERVGTKVDNVNATQSITFVTLAEAGQIDAVTAGEHAELFELWAYPAKYRLDQLRRYEGKLFKCISEHTSQEDWTPDVSSSLWVLASNPADEFPKWSQPVGAPDAYGKGAKVTHNGKKWVSDYDANTWEPSVFGWTEVS